MPTPILSTKLFQPALRPDAVARPHLMARLDAGLHRKLSLLAAPAGFGKTTLACAWASSCSRPVAWLSLDRGDNDHVRFLLHLVASLQTVLPGVGEGVATALQSSQPPSVEALLTSLINDVARDAVPFLLVLDDVHVVDSPVVTEAMAFWLEHQPTQCHLVMTTREDPPLPLARLRVRDQLTELRAAVLRFSTEEAERFLRQTIGLSVSQGHLEVLQHRTEGWIAGLQLAAVSMQGCDDVDAFVTSFGGNHQFVVDYLLEEVLQQQPLKLQSFLLETSVLQRMCASLCDALLDVEGGSQALLRSLSRNYLFVVPLDDSQTWFRYHHLFAELLRQRLRHQTGASGHSTPEVLHLRASAWYEANDLPLDAFEHALAANDATRAADLVEGVGEGGLPLLFLPGAAASILQWLHTLSDSFLAQRPGLLVAMASGELFAGRVREAILPLQRAEALLEAREHLDEGDRDLLGHIATTWATLAVVRHDDEVILAQSERAFALLKPTSFPLLAAAHWTRGYGHLLRGRRDAARSDYTMALSMSERVGHFIIALGSTIGLARLHEMDESHDAAIEWYQRAIGIAGEPAQPMICQAYMGLARIAMLEGEWELAHTHANASLILARQLKGSDREVACLLLLARIASARGDSEEAEACTVRARQLAEVQGHDVTVVERVELHGLVKSDKAPPSHVSANMALVEPLSQRELEILACIARGFSNKQICQALHIAESTVKGHNQNIFGKLGVRRRTQAVAKARSIGLIE